MIKLKILFLCLLSCSAMQASESDTQVVLGSPLPRRATYANYLLDQRRHQSLEERRQNLKSLQKISSCPEGTVSDRTTTTSSPSTPSPSSGISESKEEQLKKYSRTSIRIPTPYPDTDTVNKFVPIEQDDSSSNDVDDES